MVAERLSTIPPPRPDDTDDVRWALSTANALWSNGASEDALKWLRRAGETASESDDDMRAVELFKAAASLRTSMLPPALAAQASPDPSPPEPVSEVRTRIDPRSLSSSASARPASSPPGRPLSSPPARRAPPPPPARRAARDVSPTSPRAVATPPPPPPTPRVRPASSAPPAADVPLRSQHDTSRGVGRDGSVVSPPVRAAMPFDLKETKIGLGAVRIHPGFNAAGAPVKQAATTKRATPSAVKLSSTRFVVTPGTARGELLLKVLPTDAEPPKGVAVAVISPRDAQDAELIDRILEAGAGFFDLHHDDEPTNPGAGGERARRVG